MRSDHDNPTNYIFEEMDKLADKIMTDAGLNYDNGAENRKKRIRAILDDWVKKKVIRFNAQMDNDSVRGPTSGPSRELINHKFLEMCGHEIMEMGSFWTSHLNEQDITLYIIGSKENF